MRLLWEEQAWDDYCYWQTQDKKDAETDKCFNQGYSAGQI